MRKTKIEIEFHLNNASHSVLWNSIGTPLGLSEWFSDGVTVAGNQYTFTWERNDQTALLLSSKTNVFIRFQWLDDENTDVYFEMKIVSMELSNDLTLFITDFSDPDDVDDTILIWNKQIEVLRRKTGL